MIYSLRVLCHLALISSNSLFDYITSSKFHLFLSLINPLYWDLWFVLNNVHRSYMPINVLNIFLHDLMNIAKCFKEDWSALPKLKIHFSSKLWKPVEDRYTGRYTGCSPVAYRSRTGQCILCANFKFWSAIWPQCPPTAI